VDGHVIHTLLGLLFDDFEHQLRRQIFRALDARDGFVNRHGAHGHGRGFDDGFANGGNIAAGGKIHHGVRAVVHGVMQLIEFLLHFGGDRGISDIRVDLAFEGDADAHGLERFVIDIGGNDGAAARDFAAHQLGFDFFARRDEGHLFGDHALPRVVHLRDVARAVLGRFRRLPLTKPRFSRSHRSPPQSSRRSASRNRECSIVKPSVPQRAAAFLPPRGRRIA
jgi:hypothetical protein